MRVWCAALLLVAAVLLLVRVLGLLARSRTVLTVAHAALAVIGNRLLDDEAKENALRRHAFHLFKLFAFLLAGGVLAVGLPLAALTLADRAGAVSRDAVLARTLSWPFLLGSIAATAVVLVAGRRRARPHEPADGFEDRYSATERGLLYLAFAGDAVQVACARLEDRLWRRRLAPLAATRPVFITALPRAGTTLLLNQCARLDEFVTHTYRHMPFVLMPLLWDAFSRLFRVADPVRERAHGDGLLVNADSPEAMEEMLWLHFWPEHYEAARIRPWTPGETRPGFVAFFRNHVRKLSALAGPSRDSARVRYLSKNNANIARVRWLLHAFPDARVVVPFRAPLQHAASLLRQHRRFLEIHRRDPFARDYMAGIGHFDFGETLRPIDFQGWRTEDEAGAPATSLAYWLRYWIAAYGPLAGEDDPRVLPVDFDALCAAPGAGLLRLAEFLELEDPAALTVSGSDIRVPKAHRVDPTEVPPALLHEAAALHARLQARAARETAAV